MAEKFGFLRKIVILLQYITEPISNCTVSIVPKLAAACVACVFPGYSAAGGTFFRHSVPLTRSFSATYDHTRRSLDAATYRFILS